MKVIGVIPARYGSTRFPAKVLAPILGRPMVEWVWQAASSARLLDEVYIATDDDRVREAAEGFGANVVMTSLDHASGTDRIGEVARLIPCDYVVNIQGDEPTILGETIDKMVAEVTSEGAEMGTLACPTGDVELVSLPTAVKVVMDDCGNALYFSRSPIPYPRNAEFARFFIHLGLYIYRRETLFKVCSLPQTLNEQSESLEQLRALANGIRIKVVRCDTLPMAVDVPGEIAGVEEALRRR